MTEKDIQNQIRLNITDIAVSFRANVGMFFTKDGRPITTGLPKGFSDLFGFRKSDNKMFFIEVKTPTGRASKEQVNFINAMKKHGCLAGIARSVEDARAIINQV